MEIIQEGVSRVFELRATTHIKTMVLGTSWNSVCEEGIEALRSVMELGTLPALRVSDTGSNSIQTNMENIRTVLTEDQALGINIRSLEVSGYYEDEGTFSAVSDILESTRHLQHFCLFLPEDCPIGLKKLSDQLKHLDLLSVVLEGNLITNISSLFLLLANSKFWPMCTLFTWA